MNIRKNIHKTTLAALTISAALAYAPVSSAALSYSQDWEGNTAGAAGGVGDGWIIGNVDNTTGGQWFAGLAAPTQVGAWADFVDEGGAAQGNTQLSAFTDYNNNAIFAGNNVVGFLYKDLGTVTSDMVGTTYAFSFDGKWGNIDGSGLNDPGDANAYITILTQDGNFNTQFNGTFNYTGLPGDGSWGGGSVEVPIIADYVGSLLQIGFSHETNLDLPAAGTNDWDTAVYYDNLCFSSDGGASCVSAVPVPAAVWLFGSGLLGLVGVARRRKQA